MAKNLQADSYGLVFGINMFMSLLLQTILTVVVVEVLQLSPHTQVTTHTHTHLPAYIHTYTHTRTYILILTYTYIFLGFQKYTYIHIFKA